MPQLFTNNARALLASGITDTATALTVEASKADLFPTANTGTNPVPSENNWFKVTLQDTSGNVEIVYVRTRTAGSGIMSNLMRGQEGTTARAFSAGTVVGLRITAADVEGSIAAALNSMQVTGNQTVEGTKTFNGPIIANGGVQGNVTGNVSGNVSGNAGTVTNGVYTTGDQPIGGVKTFSSVPVAPGLNLTSAFGSGNGVYNGNGDAATSTQANLQIRSWFGIGFSPSGIGHPVPQNENAVWIDTRTGNLSARGNITAGGQFIGNGSVPPGAVMHFAMNSPPTGWLRANGAAVSRATFAALFAAIGTTYGVGDGSTTFNLPDLRGEFIRGHDDGRGVDSGRAFGSAQAGEIQSHTHVVQNVSTTSGQLMTGDPITVNVFGNGSRTSNATGGTETRPRNIAMLACIKF